MSQMGNTLPVQQPGSLFDCVLRFAQDSAQSTWRSERSSRQAAQTFFVKPPVSGLLYQHRQPQTVTVLNATAKMNPFIV